MTTPPPALLTLAEVDLLAEVAHAGQLDKAGEPYIGHPRRVAAYVSAAGGSAVQQAAALLHDVVEDTSTDLADLDDAGVDPRVLRLVEALTHREGEPRSQYVARVAVQDGAALVKLGDIYDNAHPARLARLDQRTRDRLRQKYDRDRAQLAELIAGRPLAWQ